MGRIKIKTGIQEVLEQVSAALNELRPLFNEKCQLSFIARLPGNNEADILISNDDIDALKDLLGRCQRRVTVLHQEEPPT